MSRCGCVCYIIFVLLKANGDGGGEGRGCIKDKRDKRAIARGGVNFDLSGEKAGRIFTRMRHVIWVRSSFSFGHTDYFSFLSQRIDVKITL